MAKKGRKKKKNKKAHRAFWIAVRIQIALMVVILGFVAYYYLGGYAKTVKELRAEANTLVAKATLDTFRANQTSLVYDAKGQLISTVKAEKDVYYLTFDKIPRDFVDAIISVEDKKFYNHHGINKIERGLEQTADYDGKALMTTKYCLRYELGCCLQGKSNGGPQVPLQPTDKSVLVNNTRRFQLEFDCHECLMKIIALK